MCMLYVALYAMKHVVGEQAKYTLHYHTILQTTISKIRQNLQRYNTRIQNLLRSIAAWVISFTPVHSIVVIFHIQKQDISFYL